MKKHMRKRYGAAALAVTLGVLLGGCGVGKNENYSAGMEAVAALEYDNAIALFTAAREAGGNERLISRGEGLAYMGKTMYAESAKACGPALSYIDGRVNNMDYDNNYHLATAYYKPGEPKRANAAYNCLIALRREEEDAYYLRGVMYAEQGNLDMAKADFDRLVSIDKNDYDKLINIYGVLDENGYKETGQQYLQTAMDAGTKGMTNYEKGRICYYLEDYENARTYLEKAREEGGYEAALFLGKTYEILGDLNYAISVYNSYLENEEPNARMLNQLGLCKMRAEDYAGALTAFQSAINIEDNGMMQTLKMNEIVAYERLGQYEEAASRMSSYLSSYPDDEAAKREYEFLKTR